ncbi:hypothetical protein LMH87_000651 [Akanthomyces muscarius]|uniref:Uncharacterized protein n=1 Tax=Akanthomyces muscarius TaxID=2231603 RepID=A0A9W8UNV2_AKAMU|nr:hypothetical protein LMH87_000651 [Akanthomyces muscarius]KAJ4155404.1 hypothetical protein LMH87_000651 [Akanthomyces muscarius]
MRTFAVIVYTLSQLARFAHGAEDPLGGILEDLLGDEGDNKRRLIYRVVSAAFPMALLNDRREASYFERSRRLLS